MPSNIYKYLCNWSICGGESRMAHSNGRQCVQFLKQAHNIPTTVMLLMILCIAHRRRSPFRTVLLDPNCWTLNTFGGSIRLDLAFWFLWGRSFGVLNSVKSQQILQRNFDLKKKNKFIWNTNSFHYTLLRSQGIFHFTFTKLNHRSYKITEIGKRCWKINIKAFCLALGTVTEQYRKFDCCKHLFCSAGNNRSGGFFSAKRTIEENWWHPLRVNEQKGYLLVRVKSSSSFRCATFCLPDQIVYCGPVTVVAFAQRHCVDLISLANENRKKLHKTINK